MTSLKVVPRGTEGAVSLEGTLAGLSASLVFCALAYIVNQVCDSSAIYSFVHMLFCFLRVIALKMSLELLCQVSARDALICIVASQTANFLESYAGAAIQDKKGFEWVRFLTCFSHILVAGAKDLNLASFKVLKALCNLVVFLAAE